MTATIRRVEGFHVDATHRSQGSAIARDPRKIAVMHGRDEAARRVVFDLLRRIGLEPLEWNELIHLTGAAAPYNGEAVAAAFEAAQAVVVLLTPDDVGFLHPGLHGDREREDDRAPTGQARLNVLVEAGMALQSHPSRTVLVEIGRTREISDLAGRNTIRLDGSSEKFHSFAERLEDAGCPVRLSGNDWLDASGVQQLETLNREAPNALPAQPVGAGLALVAVKGGHYEAFRIRGTGVEHRRREKHWSAWTEFGGFSGEALDVAAVSAWPQHAEVFVLLASGEVVHRSWWKEKGWGRFHSLGKPFGGGSVRGVAAATLEEGHQEVFVEAPDGAIANLWHVDGDWHRNGDPATQLGDGWWSFSA
jgi:predicted nucleotide-binding protein